MLLLSVEGSLALTVPGPPRPRPRGDRSSRALSRAGFSRSSNATLSSHGSWLAEVCRMTDSFGARLRQRREQQDIALLTIAEQTKIKLSLLEALERDDVSQWPAGIFRR